jgi:hypothetical protein
MVDYTIINGTEAQLANVNAGGTDVEALSTKDGVTLDNTELAAVLTNDYVAVMADQTGSATRTQAFRVVATASKFLSA